ncbi:MAG TPA: hypothetical protein VGJ35_02625, partial [Burkholderiaceae bacterium]
AARLAQELELAPAAQESAIELQKAQAEQARQHGEYFAAGGHVTPTKPPPVGGFEDYVIRKYGANPTPEQIAEGRKVYQQADDRPRVPPALRFVPKMIVVGGKEIQANYDATTGKYHDPDTGAVLNGVGVPPTADMRNKEAGRALVGRSIGAIENLSKRILTSVGPEQRLEALKRGTEAVFGNDPTFRTYQDARMSLAGNLAVAQQGSRPSDADIKAIWLPLVPDAYRDTSESAAMKWDLIKTMSNSPTAPLPSAGISPNVQRILDMLKERSASPR